MAAMRLLVSIVLFLAAGAASAAGYVWLGTRIGSTDYDYDVLFDHAPSRAEVYSSDMPLDCGIPATVTRVFTNDLAECFAVTESGAWQYEGVAFLAGKPLSDGTCRYPPQRALHRIWRPFGETRHRFTVDRTVVDDMAAQGWIDEGPVMCVAG
jgi:hypothetical protein